MFTLHDVQGYEHNEIAGIMGCSVGNSKSQLQKPARNYATCSRKKSGRRPGRNVMPQKRRRGIAIELQYCKFRGGSQRRRQAARSHSKVCGQAYCRLVKRSEGPCSVKKWKSSLRNEGWTPLSESAREHVAGCGACQSLVEDLTFDRRHRSFAPRRSRTSCARLGSLKAQLEQEGIIKLPVSTAR